MRQRNYTGTIFSAKLMIEDMKQQFNLLWGLKCDGCKVFVDFTGGRKVQGTDGNLYTTFPSWETDEPNFIKMEEPK